MQFCPHYNMCAWREESSSRMLFMRLRCGSWNCEFCAERNRWLWQSFLHEQLPIVSDAWWLMTLTAHSRLRSAEKSLANIRSKIDPLMKRVRRTFGKVEYVRVYEPHPSSQAVHAHLVVSGLAPFVAIGASSRHQVMALGITERTYRDGIHDINTWLKDTAQSLSLGYIADCRKVENTGKAVRYVTKYLTKAQGAIHEKHLRHVQTTRRIGSPSSETDLLWQTGYSLREADVGQNQSIVDIQTGEVLAKDYWLTFQSYPHDI